MKRPLVWRIVSIIISLAVLFALTLYGGALLFNVTGNPVGTILTVIACVIVGLGTGLLYLGNLEVDEHSVLWENERVFASNRTPETISYPFHLEKPSVITGHVSGTSGPYEFFLAEFLGIHARQFETRYALRPQIYLRGEGPREVDIRPLSLPSGAYVLRFEGYPREIKTSFTLRKTVRKKPHENYYAFGLTLLEVGVPILITGVISLGFGTFVS